MSDFVSLEEFIPQITPRFMAPRHLRPLTNLFQRIADGETVKACVSCPPRFSKTETILHGAAWLQIQDPTLQIAYASYGAALSRHKSKRARDLAKLAGVPIDPDSRAKADWQTGCDDGGMWATSVGGAITGMGFHLVIVDDPVKGRAEAESGLLRERAYTWWQADVSTRLEPGGSVIVTQTRWHPDDLAGRLIDEGWEHINLPAITPEGESLWPERWPLPLLLERREAMGGEDGYEWQSLYMGNPRGRGSRVFGDVSNYGDKPDLSHAVITVGLDFAYSKRTSADWSVAIALAKVGELAYVLDVVRLQVEPRLFRTRVQLLRETYPTARFFAYAAATEMGGVEFMRDGGIPITGWPAKVDKFVRAIGVTAAWNQGKVLLPPAAKWNQGWLDAFVSEICGFTGIKDRHDDQVDALAAAFDGLPKREVEQPRELTPEEYVHEQQAEMRRDAVRKSEERKRKQLASASGRRELFRKIFSH